MDSSMILNAVVHNRQFDRAQKKHDSKQSTSLITAITRTLFLKPLKLFYHIPIKLFRPAKVDSLLVVRQLALYRNEENLSFRSSLVFMKESFQREGIGFFYRHLLPPLVVNAAIGYTLFASYFTFRSLFQETNFMSRKSEFSKAFVAGSLAGAVQSAVGCPIDTLKVRFEIQDLVKGHHSTVTRYVLHCIRKEGMKGLYRGFAISLIKDTVAYGMFFGIFESLGKSYRRSANNWKENFINICPDGGVKGWLSENWIFLTKPCFITLSGIFSGIVYQAINIPFDNVKNVYLLEDMKRTRRRDKMHRTFQLCERLATKQGGWRRFLFQGFYISALRAVPPATFGLFVFEKMRNIMEEDDQY